MTNFIVYIYWLLLPVILGAICNMIWVKLPILKSWKIPMDGGKKLKDGKRVFGDNKTWKGFFGMIILTAIFAWAFGVFSFLEGAWLGFAYVLAELPNSFIKRRLNIKQGANGGIIQTFFDQADSAIGYAIFLLIIRRLSLQEMLAIIFIATATHYIFNVLLYFVGLKNQKG